MIYMIFMMNEDKYKFQFSENELKKMKKLLVRFHTNRLMQEANRVWEEQNWSDEKVDELLNTKLRK